MKTEIVKLTEKRTIAVYSTDDVEPVLDHNKLLQTLEQTNTDGLKHTHSIPPIVLVKWLNEEWSRGSNVRYLSKEFDEIILKKLKDPEWAFLRVGGPSHRVGYGD